LTVSATTFAAVMFARWASLPLDLVVPSLRINTGWPLIIAGTASAISRQLQEQLFQDFYLNLTFELR